MDDCVFCAIATANPPGQTVSPTVILSTERVLAFFDIQPLVTSTAHILVVPRTHHVTTDELAADLDTAGALGKALAVVSKSLKTTLDATAFNIIQNNGAAAGQVVDHVHFHLVIRQPAPLADSRASFASIFAAAADSLAGLGLRERASYWSLVYGRDRRNDLDESWAIPLARKLRASLADSVSKL